MTFLDTSSILSADLTSYELSHLAAVAIGREWVALHVSRQSTDGTHGIHTFIIQQCRSSFYVKIDFELDINTTPKESKSKWSCSRRQLCFHSAVFSVSETDCTHSMAFHPSHNAKSWLFTICMGETGRFTIQNW